MNDTAYLSNKGEYIHFRFGDRTIRFMSSRALESIREVKLWDQGYLVVNAKFSHSNEPVEDYIDLNDILRSLHQDADAFVAPIKKVEVRNV